LKVSEESIMDIPKMSYVTLFAAASITMEGS
jgi:hypothetical protein